ncbi:MAG: hypothetical protein HZB77_06895 [Chloroflexi bacterium]|nr:hypothetical protein [Chloroflexota bacterium]MBI5349033.1 hypothetical protein [Chloroflexota bacterium]
MVESFIVMLQTNSEIKPPVGVIESLTGGFETAASRLPAVFFPLAFDLFLWLGPRLSINPLIQQLINLVNSAPAPDAASDQNRQAIVEMWRIMGEKTNLFTLFSTWPVGVPSLMSAELPTLSPNGKPLLLSLDNGLLMLFFVITFSLIGLLLGAIYYNVLASSLREQPLTLNDLLVRSIINWAKLVVFVLLVMLMGGIISVPFLLVIGLLQLINVGLAAIGVSIWGAMAMWLWIYIAFTWHGMVLRDRSVWGAMWDSMRLVQFNLFPVMGLYILTFVLNWGLGYLWSLPAEDSWLTLAAIGGHAFVSTALVAATFVFYKDRYRWWVEVRSQKIR